MGLGKRWWNRGILWRWGANNKKHQSVRKAFSLISIMLFAECLFAQTTETLEVQQVKENARIDILLNGALRNNNLSNSCFVLQFYFPAFMHYNLCITVIKTAGPNVNLYNIDYKNNLRFFPYKGFTIFVVGPGDPYHFFKKLPTTKDFSFLNTFDKNNRTLYLEMQKNKHVLAFYKYDNGKFVYPFQAIH
jgi:hypothetical protein